MNSMAKQKPIVGFFPLFYNLAETGRSVLIAKEYIKRGGEAIFFSHGGEYEYLAEEIGCRVVQVDPLYSDEFIDLLWKSSRLETFKNPFNCKNLDEHVRNEVKAFCENKVKLILSTNNWPCYISARVAKLPLIFVTPKVIPNFSIYPEDAEFFITRFLPEKLKLKILNWYVPKSKMYVRPFKKIAKKYGISPPENSHDINHGDYTFYTSFKELLDIDESDIRPNEFFITPISLKKIFTKNSSKEYTDEKEVIEHINQNDKSILLTLGSSGTKELFLKLINALSKTDYNVIAIFSSILDESDLPDTNKNILLKKFVPSISKINKMVDIAVIHGGEGTVLTVARCGKPVIGFPMQFEQHLNLEMLVKNGMARIESRKYFKEEVFLKAVEDVFDKYDMYLKNAQALAKTLPESKGDVNAAKRIIEIISRTDNH